MTPENQRKELWTRGPIPFVLLLLLCACLYLPGLTNLPATDRDEARFAQASRQMLESGNYIDIRFQQESRYKKPIGIYWLQAAAAAGTTGAESKAIWPYRLPSLLGAVLAVLLTYFFGQSLFDRRAALLGACLLASSLILTVEAHIATTDAVLLACMVAMQGALGKIYLAASRQEQPKTATILTFWVACGAGILIKGPLAPAVALLTLGSLTIADRNLRTLRCLRWRLGLTLLLFIVLPWFVAIAVVTKGEFFRQAIGQDLLPKLVGGQESHGFSFGTYALLFPVLFWPGSLFALWALWPSLKMRAEKAVRFCFAWILPNWLMFELVPTKLAHYVLPTFPAIALLTGYCLSHADQWSDYLRQKPFKWLKWIPVILWGAVAVVLAVGLIGLPLYFNHRPSVASLGVIAGVAILLAGVPRFWRENRTAASVLCGVSGGLVVFAFAFSMILPGLQGFWLSRQAQQALQQVAPTPHPMVAAVGYHEPSLVFSLGTATKLTDAEGAGNVLASDPPGLALVADKQKDAFLAAAEKAGVTPVSLSTFRGYNYVKGHWLNLTLYSGHPTVKPTPAADEGKTPSE